MKIKNPFDARLEAQYDRIPQFTRDAAIHLTDTLDIAWAAVQAVFEAKAKPEHALTLLSLYVQREERLREQAKAEIAQQRASGD